MLYPLRLETKVVVVEDNRTLTVFKNGFKIILSDPNVRAVLVNIFGGIVRCDRVANGIVDAVRELELGVPVVVRLAGTNSEEAKGILAASGVALTPADTLNDAAAEVVTLTTET